MQLSNKGIALIILIIAMTLTGLMGAAIVSIMGAKQKSYPSQAHSYQAHALAHAGIEFAIRYVYDNRDGFNISTTSPYIYLPQTGGTFPTKVIDLGGGKTIELSYLHDTGSHISRLTSIGKYGTAQRKIELINFCNYANVNCP
jgi:hypothetical protein